jgi:hypothetical protein
MNTRKRTWLENRTSSPAHSGTQDIEGEGRKSQKSIRLRQYENIELILSGSSGPNYFPLLPDPDFDTVLKIISRLDIAATSSNIASGKKRMPVYRHCIGNRHARDTCK